MDQLTKDSIGWAGHDRGMAPAAMPSRLIAAGYDALRDTVTGLLGSVVLIANAVSFAALMFPGGLGGGIPVAVWSMLIGSCICGIWIGLRSSLPPVATGIDSPTGTVLILLSATTAADVAATGGNAQTAVQTVMLVFTAATVLCGVLLYLVGLCRWGSYLRFVPYCVVGGFLGATGALLIAGGFRTATGRAMTLDGLTAPWTTDQLAKLACAVATLAVLLTLRRFVKSAFALPTALLVMCVAGTAVLRSRGLAAPEHGWYLHSLGTLTAWQPFEAARATHLTWSMMPGLLPQLFAVAVVALISLVTKVSSIEVTRQTSGDLDREFRAHGVANLIAAPFGGLTASLQVGSGSLLYGAGAKRMSGVICACTLGVVGLANFDLPGLVPIPIITGLVLYLGYNFLVEALWRPYAQRAWLDLGLSLVIMILCIRFGYLFGVLAGLVCACMLFAVSYARLGVVRRHLTRENFTSNVDRPIEVAAYLREAGAAIQLYWLSGYIFFGSSEGVFERVRANIEAVPAPQRVTHVVLDFGMVSGADSSAVVSLRKLRNFCDQHGATLVYCSLSAANHAALQRTGFFGGKSRHQAYADLNTALAWCEDQLLAKASLGAAADTSLSSFEPWLQRQLGPSVEVADFLVYLERKETARPQVLYRQGEPADTLDLVASGHLAVDIAMADGEILRVRRTETHTVIGEMGFFRRSVRSATVSSTGAATLFTLTRDNLERMRRERPDLASAFTDFILCVLADRIDTANREVAALGPLVTSTRG